MPTPFYGWFIVARVIEMDRRRDPVAAAAILCAGVSCERTYIYIEICKDRAHAVWDA